MGSHDPNKCGFVVNWKRRNNVLWDLNQNTFCCQKNAFDCRPKNGHFTNTFTITIQIQWKIHFAVILSMAIISPQILAHGTTAWPSCHVQKFVAISLLKCGWNQTEISIKFELGLKNCLWNGRQTSMCYGVIEWIIKKKWSFIILTILS